MRIGVTGIFASGKGTVCGLFEELGAVVVDTDIVARDIMEPGAEGLKMVLAEFGADCINGDGTLDRRKFANTVFKDPEKVKKLNSITHPEIRRIVMERTSGNGIYMINTPLLFESGFDKIMDLNIVVFAENEQALERGMLRDGISAEEIKDRLNHQIPLKEKKKLADHIIDNSGSLENTRRQVVKLWKILIQNPRE